MNEANARGVLQLYRESVRPFLEENLKPSVTSLDRSAEVLEAALARKELLSVGIIGESQVGKSSIVNALLDRVALPSGGIGPLTAQATRVTWSEDETLEVRYHGRSSLNRHLFTLATHLKRLGKIEGDVDDVDLDETLQDQLVAHLESEIADESKPYQSKIGDYVRDQALLMLTGGLKPAPTMSDADLVLGIRAVLGVADSEDVATLPQDVRDRCRAIAELLGTTTVIARSSVANARAFNDELRLRAAGWLSPLVEQLHLRIGTPELKGMTLVDLPGFGVVADPGGKVAEEFVRTEGNALVIVGRNNGFTDVTAAFLEGVGVIPKLLFGGRDGRPAIEVVLVVTYLDQVVRDHYMRASAEARESGEPRPDRHELFRRESAEMALKLRAQVRDALMRSRSFEGFVGEQRERREQAVEELCRTMSILCVDAPDYLAARIGVDDGVFLTDEEATNVPALRQVLANIATQASTGRSAAIDEAGRALVDEMIDDIEAVANAYEYGRGRGVTEWETFREGLEALAGQLKHELSAYQGEVNATLHSTIPAVVRNLCKEAQLAAERKLVKLRDRGEAMHVMSLRAALTREGVWERNDKIQINYPKQLTYTIVESIATDWEPKVVEAIRTTVKSLSHRNIKIVEKLCEHASAQDEKIVAESHIEVQKKSIRNDANSCIRWTSARLEEMQADIQTRLFNVVTPPIAAACERAIKNKTDRGIGARSRILQAFHEGSQKAIEQATKEAERVLMEYYEALRRELEKGYLAQHGDPIGNTLKALMDEELGRARRSDGQRKRHVLDRVAKLQPALAEYRAEAA